MSVQPDLSRLTRMNEELRRGMQKSEDILKSAAERAATEANAYFAARKTPVRVDVRQGVRGSVLVISATKRLRKPFTGRSPEAVVREILERHATAGAEQVAVEVARSLR